MPNAASAVRDATAVPSPRWSMAGYGCPLWVLQRRNKNKKEVGGAKKDGECANTAGYKYKQISVA